MNEDDSPKAGLFAPLALITFLLNCGWGYLYAGGLNGAEPSAIIGGITGAAVVYPLVAIVLISVFPSKRNARSQAKVFFLVSLVVCLLYGYRFMTIANEIADRVMAS